MLRLTILSLILGVAAVPVAAQQEPSDDLERVLLPVATEVLPGANGSQGPADGTLDDEYFLMTETMNRPAETIEIASVQCTN